LWEGLAQIRDASPSTPLFALVTDIGNDLVFGNEPQRIAEWVEDCITRLRAHQARVTIGRLPLDSIRRLGRFRFQATRTLFFPNSSLTYHRVQTAAPQLDELIAAMASRLGLASFVPRPEWYGFDPIHIRRAQRGAAWQHAVSQWGLELDRPAHAPGIRASWQYWRLQPAERRTLGRERTTFQPGWKWPDGSAIWLY
jgi:hypothetical protein